MIDLTAPLGGNQKTDCFAYNANKTNHCAALTNGSCRNCKFYKNSGQMCTELQRCAVRLAKLPKRRKQAQKAQELYLRYSEYTAKESAT